MTLRAPRIEEAAALTELCLRAKAVWGYDAAFLEACRAELTVTARHLAEDACHVAEAEGQVAGFVQLRRKGPDADLVALFIEPARQGIGLGRALFAWAEATAREMGAASLLIESDPGAAPFYARMGAVPDGVVPSGSIPGRFVPRLRLAL